MNHLPPTMRRIYLLGGLRAEAARISGDKTIGLLAYLALHPQALHPREVLIELLWPDLAPDRARRRLSDTLHRLRKSLAPACLISDDERVGLNAAAVWIDADEFLKLSEASDAAALQHAVALYTGDLLPEMYDDWILPRRVLLREKYLNALLRLGTLAETQGQAASALGYFHRLAGADPLREDAQRGVMRCLARTGRLAEALEAYARLEALLRAELAIVPAADTRALAESIQTEMEMTRQILARPAPPPFVGRASERSLALEAVEAALAGRGGLIAVEGEAGLGKSRLLAEIAAGATWRGVTVVKGRTTEYPSASPLAPLAEVLTSALGGARLPQIETLLPAETLAALAPLIDRWREHTPLPELPPLSAQQRFHQALVDVLHTLVNLAPHAILIDDAHWATSAVWDALNAVVPALASSRLLIVVAYRRSMMEQTAGWKILQRWEREGGLKVIALAAFKQDDIAQLLPPDKSSTTADVLALTGGNPFFVSEVIADIVAGLPLRRDPIHARIAALSPPDVTTLEAAAVLGMSASYSAWARTIDRPPLLLAQAAERLAAHGLLQVTAEGYAFTHDLIQAAIYEQIDPGRRRRLHRQAAQFWRDVEPGHVHALALHLDRAGEAAEAAQHYRAAGTLDLDRFAFAEAQTSFERALELLPTQPTRERTEVWLSLARMCDVLGRRERQREALEAALHDARKIEDDALVIQALLLNGHFAAQTAQVQAAAERFTAARALAAQTGDTTQQMEVTFLLGDLATRQGQHTAAHAYFEQVLTQAQQLGDQNRRARALRGLGMVARRNGETAQAVTWLEQALQVQHALGDRIGESITRVNLMSCCYDLNAWDRLLALADETWTLCTALNRKASLALVRHLQGLGLNALGDFAAARQQLIDCLQMYDELGDRVSSGLAHNALGLVAEADGDLLEAQREYTAALDLAEEANATVEAAYARHDLGALYLRRNDPAAAVPLLEAARAKWRELGNDLLRLKSEAFLGLALLVDGDRSAAQALAEENWRGFLRGGLSGEQPQGWLWPLYQLLRQLAQHERAASVVRAAYAELQRQGAAITDDRLRQQFFNRVPLNRAIVDAYDHLNELQRRLMITLVRADVPLGRTLSDRDYVTIEWTLAAPEDEAIVNPIDRRRHVLSRLIAEARSAHAAPTDDDLARALDVSRRTILRDIEALNRSGVKLPTRRRKS